MEKCQENAIPMKTLNDAIDIAQYYFENLEKAAI
jgi:hypothetical protein